MRELKQYIRPRYDLAMISGVLFLLFLFSYQIASGAILWGIASALVGIIYLGQMLVFLYSYKKI